MHGWGCEERKHMRPVSDPDIAASTATAAPPHPGPSLVAAAAGSNHSSPDSFLKDGRKFHVGDCALFQAGNCRPPCIGIICWFMPCGEACLKLGVNWLYRPSDVKLAKGIFLDAAPNEIFYSFHKDEISAELLLHPCKVAFLCKGVELPSGISSFVCRRGYDIANECLWWLTDQHYINERQEEVDQLLGKTQVEMNAAVQPGGRSPKQLNGTSSTQPLKSGSDGVQNSNTFSSQAKGRKRGDKGDLVSESLKREHTSKADEGDSGNCKLESIIRAEIAKITDKGGLINNDAVEKLVQLMQLDRGERKIDLACRILLADVIAATDRNDFLGRFLQLKGVPVLDDWLQDAHRGKSGDGSSPKEGDRSLEELLLSVLRALDKLPVNLDALQTCNIGKSVNHLRGHKNLEIQKKARSLVDTWKKRVDAEMTKIEMTKLNDTKSIGSSQPVSWPGKSGFSEVSYGGNKRGGMSEVAVKSVVTQTSACKSFPVKIGHGDSVVKSNPASSGSLKSTSSLSASVSVGTKDSQSKTGGSSWTGELPLTMIKEEKSSSSSQSQNNSQSCSGDHTKTMGSTSKEESRSPAAGSMNATKTSGGSRHRKSSNGFIGTSVSGVHRDNGLGKSSSLSRNIMLEKVPQTGITGEKLVDVPVTDHGNSHRLIVRLPNPGRSPARSTSGGSFDDPSLTGSRASSPGASEKNEHTDRRSKLSDVRRDNIAADVNSESWQSNDLKCVVGFVDCDRSAAVILDEERSITDETVVDVSRSTSSSQPKCGKSFEASMSSINALIESCVKYSEASASSGADDSGMNLLASVATGEISKSDMLSPTGSPGENSPAAEDPCTGNETQSTFSSDDVLYHVSGCPEINAENDCEKHESNSSLHVRDEMHQNVEDSITNSFGYCKSVVPSQENTSGNKEQFHVSTAALSKNAERTVKSESNHYVVAADDHAPLSTLPANVEGLSKEDPAKQLRKRRKASGSVTDGIPDCKRKARSASEGSMPVRDGTDLDYVATHSIKREKEPVQETSSCPLGQQNVVDELLHDSVSTDQKLHPVVVVCVEDCIGNPDNEMAASASAILCPKVDEIKKKDSDDMAAKGQLEPSDNEKKDITKIVAPTIDDRIVSSVLSTDNGVEENLEKEAVEHHSSALAIHEEACAVPADETEQCAKSTCSKLSRGEADEVGEEVTCAEASSAVASPVLDTRRCDFDLNEGFSVDEGNLAEPGSSSVLGFSSAVQLPNLQPFTVSPMSSSSPIPITVAAPAKGPFVPPETLLKSKGEPGWKGSAATSAFRPAEPRKVLETPFNMLGAPPFDSTAGKQCRPPLDIDLNVPDERVLEDIACVSSAQVRGSESRVVSTCDLPMRSSGGLDLDLNRVDESTENGQYLGSTSHRLEVPFLPGRLASREFPNGGANVLKDFDLNNGPCLDEASSEQVPRGQHTIGSSLPFFPSLRTNNSELGNLSTWFPGNSYPAIAIPSFLPDSGDQPYPVVAAPGSRRILSSATSGGAFGSDLYRGPVLSSSPAMAFSPAAAFSYAGFPLGSSFPLASTSFSGLTTHVESASGGVPCFPAIPAPLMGSASAAASAYMRPYVISLHEGSTSVGSECSQKWAQQNLDLNAGPGGVGIEGRVERPPLTSRQLSVPSSQAFAEEHARLYQAAGRSFKRKEPEGGWDVERFAYK